MIFVIGPLPPPIHGMALVTELVRNHLLQLNNKVITLDISGVSLERSYFTRLLRVHRIFHGLLKFFLLNIKSDRSSVYIALSGGFGQFYDLLFILMAKFFNLEIFIHHHNIGYINKFSILTNLVISIAGRNAVHIVATSAIRLRLQEMYSKVERFRTLSAIVVTSLGVEYFEKSTHICVIGFLGNVSEEKGVYDFIETSIALNANGVNVEALIAGPFQSKRLKKNILKHIERHPFIRYIGPLYGEEKINFYRKINFFIFPAMNEYEGIVLHEAMACGVPIVARDSGSISSFIGDDVGHLVDANNYFPLEATLFIANCLEDPVSLKAKSKNAKENFLKYFYDQKIQFDLLCKDISKGCLVK